MPAPPPAYMVFQKPTQPQVRALRGATGRGVHAEYVDFLKDIPVGNGGKVLVAGANARRWAVKNRLKTAAGELGKEIKFLRSGEESVVFVVVG